jgi:uridine kinase
MRGDILLVEAHHHRAAAFIASHLMPKIEYHEYPLAIGISGESGSGKSELASALADALSASRIQSVILQQDDYFVYPPKTNDARRRADISWVGPQEVRLDRMDRDVRAIVDGAASIDKPLIIYDDDRLDTERLVTEGCLAVIAEGTYVALLETLSHRVFIDRTYQQTEPTRRRRGRERSDPFIERVLALEHEIIHPHRAHATFVVHPNFTVSTREEILEGRRHAAT